MPSLRRFVPRRTNWFFATFAMLATVAQLVVGFAPLGESWVPRRFSSHVEADGTTVHVAHNEATCASCQARSIHGTPQRPSVELPEAGHAATAPAASVSSALSSDLHLQSNPRAPPVVI